MKHCSNQLLLYSAMASRTILSDRFIPCRSSSNFDIFDISGDSTTAYTAALRSALFSPESGAPNSNILKFKTEKRKPMESLFPYDIDDNHLPGAASGRLPNKAPRKIRETPTMILDAPLLKDDFYLDLLDWSPSNILAVGLGNQVYLRHASNGRVQRLCDLAEEGDSVCSVSWATSGSDHLAVGTRTGEIQIWDASRCQRIRTMEGHRGKVTALAWRSSSPTLSSGSRDCTILNLDERKRERDDVVSKLTGHKESVCGLKWSPDNEKLASGGSDGKLFVWNRRSTKPVSKYTEHTAAVRAIAWSPHEHGLLASGGGTEDGSIRLWKAAASRATSVSCMETQSQVCKLAWSKNVDEIVSTHGYSRISPDNEIKVWKYTCPGISKVSALRQHNSRVLYLAVAPDGRQIVTGGGDETLMFWNVFPEGSKARKLESEFGGLSLGMRSHIR